MIYVIDYFATGGGGGGGCEGGEEKSNFLYMHG